MSAWSKEIPQSEVEVQEWWGTQSEFFFFLHPVEVDVPQILPHLGRSRQAVPHATEAIAREHPEDSRSILQFSRHLLGFFPLRREKVEKYKQKGKVHMCNTGWCPRQCDTTVLAPGLAAPWPLVV